MTAPSNTTVILNRGTGQFQTVTYAELKDKLKEGWEVPTAGELRHFDAQSRPLETFGENALSSLTLGLYDQMQSEGGRAQRAADIEANPIAAAAGDIAGSVAQTAMLPGAGVGASLARRTAVAAAQNSLFGVTEAVRESALKNREINAEDLAVSMLTSAGVGAGLHLGLEGVSKLGTAALKKVGTSLARENMTAASDGLLRTTIGDQKLSSDAIRTAVEEGLFTKGSSHSSNLAMAEQAILKNEKQYLESLAEADFKLDPEQFFNVTHYGEDSINNFIKKLGPRGAPLAAELDSLGASWKQLGTWAESLDSTGLDGKVKKFVQDKISSSVPGSEALNRKVAMEQVEASLQKAKETQGAWPSISGADVLSGGSNYVRKVIGRKVGDKVGYAGSNLLRDLGNGELMTGVADSFAAKLEPLLNNPGRLGAFAAPLLHAASQGSMELLEEHAALASSEQGPEYLKALGIQPESQEQLRSANQRLATLNAIAEHSRHVDEQLGEAVDMFLSGKRAKRIKADMQYDAIVDLAKDPGKILNELQTKLGANAPATTIDATATVTNALNYLQTKAPRAPVTALETGVKWKASQTEQERFGRAAQAILDPIGTVANLDRLTTEHVQALETVYPKLTNRIKLQLLEKTRGKTVPYAKRVQLSKLLGPEALNLSKNQAKLIQQMYDAQRAPPEPTSQSRSRSTPAPQTQAQRLESL